MHRPLRQPVPDQALSTALPSAPPRRVMPENFTVQSQVSANSNVQMPASTVYTDSNAPHDHHHDTNHDSNDIYVNNDDFNDAQSLPRNPEGDPLLGRWSFLCHVRQRHLTYYQSQVSTNRHLKMNELLRMPSMPILLLKHTRMTTYVM